ncbi:hypothetical protein PR048_031618 [Dryococelus australis]|uniref:DUF4817 domain-containing protein n=1 Tax=Dryococelus australis TaxID=614101 RepID=A0ABQ9G6G3_9NEOP|nr:hypothetical protein PR048_031618 [Dryococelus australis]
MKVPKTIVASIVAFQLDKGEMRCYTATNVSVLRHAVRERAKLGSAKEAMRFTCSEYWDITMAMREFGGQAACIQRAEKRISIGRAIGSSMARRGGRGGNCHLRSADPARRLKPPPPSPPCRVRRRREHSGVAWLDVTEPFTRRLCPPRSRRRKGRKKVSFDGVPSTTQHAMVGRGEWRIMVTPQEKAQCVMSPITVKRNYQRQYRAATPPPTPPPFNAIKPSILRLVKNFRETGSVLDLPRSGRPGVSEETIDNVRT